MSESLFDWSPESPEERRLREQRELEFLMEQARAKKAKPPINAPAVAGGGGGFIPVIGGEIGVAVIGTAKIGNI